MIVTGASPGSLGYATAAALADWGARLIVTTRHATEAVVQSLSGDLAGHSLDLTDADSVAEFASWVVANEKRVDVLINNAGVHLDLRSAWKEPRLAADGFEIHWRTNYLGTMQLTELLLPVLDVIGDGRVITVVSKLHARGRNEFLFRPLEPYNSWDAYGTSKLALIHAMNELPRRHPNVRAYSLHPGSVYTHIADRGLDGHRVLGVVRRALAPIESRMLLSPEDGAQTTLHCATAPDLLSGYYRNCAPATPSAETDDASVAARLWDETVAWVGSA